MPPKIKNRLPTDQTPITGVKPLLLHEVTNPSASANAAARRRQVALQPKSGSANHARHHVAPRKQG